MTYNDKPTPETIKDQILWFIEHTGQNEIRYLIPYLIGYYGHITLIIWSTIQNLEKEGIIKWVCEKPCGKCGKRCLQ